ncbi:MAG: hypothetical protein ACI841_000062 [Planctomycetota bacterium]
MAHTRGDWTPYAGIEGTDLDDADTFFASTDDRQMIYGGIRWDSTVWSALKFQYGHTELDLSDGSTADEDSLSFQWAFAF